MKETDNIQDLFLKAFENHTAPVRPEVWQGLQAKMAASSVAGTAAVKGLSSLTKWLIGAGITGSIGVATTLIMMNTQVEQPKERKSASVVQEQPVSNTTIGGNDQAVNTNQVETNTVKDLPKVASPVIEEPKGITPEDHITPFESTSQESKVSVNTVVTTVSNTNQGVKQTTTTATTNVNKPDNTQTTVTATTVANLKPEVVETQVENKTTITKNPPNIFTPNGDGDNDFYSFKSENISDFHVFVMNDQNKIVFETDSPDFEWDGTWNGSSCEDGKYICVVTGKDTLGKWFKKMWTFDLKR